MFRASSFALALLATTTPTIVAEPLTEINVPERPEGITEGPGSTLYVSQILSGSVLAVDAITGEATEVIPEQPDREAWGLWYHPEEEGQGYLWVAGGGPSYGNGQPEIYLYDLETGESVVACSPPTSNNETGHGVFINDVAVLDGIAYVTNSFSSQIMAVDVEQAMAGNCSVEEIYLPEDFIPLNSGDWGTNGVAPLKMGGFTGLLFTNEVDGTVFAMQFTAEGTTPTYQQILGQAEVLGADGINVLDDQLYVTQNTQNKIAVFNMSADENGAIFIDRMGSLTSPDYDTPATSALYDGYVFSTNSRFGEKPEISEEADNNVIGVKNTFCCGNEDDEATVTPDEDPDTETSESDDPDADNPSTSTDTASGSTASRYIRLELATLTVGVAFVLPFV